MTTGYADFGRTVQTNVLPLIAVNQVVGGTFTTPAQYVGDLGYLDVLADTTNLANNYSVTLQYWDDVAKTVFAGQDVFGCVPNAVNRIQYKSGGRYVCVIVGNTQNTDVNSIRVYVRGTNAAAIAQPGHNQKTPLILIDQTIAAGANFSAHGATIAVGDATLAIQHNSNNSWTAELQYWDTGASVWVRFVHIDGSSYGQTYIGKVTLPASQVQLVLTNGDTVGRTMIGSLTT